MKKVCLVDTNILLRRAQTDHVMHSDASQSVAELLQSGTTLFITPQNLYEFWTVATRPTTSRNGLGWTTQQCAVEIEQLLKTFVLVLDTPNLYHEWYRLVSTYNVNGVAAHDARLVAAMKLHNIEEILTFNTGDFARYAPENIRVLDPSQIVSQI